MRKYFKSCLAVMFVVTISLGIFQNALSKESSKEYFSNTKQEQADPEWPKRSITVMVPFSPGGVNDIMANRYNPYLKKELGENITTEYISGAGGAVGWTTAVKKDPDGYYVPTINLPHTILQPIARDAGYETQQLIPVAYVNQTPNAIAVPEDAPYDTLEEFIEYAEENPGAVTLSGTGEYSGHHIATLEFMDKTGVEVTYVPFPGSAPQTQALLGGHVAGTFGNSNELLRVEDKVKILAIGSEERMPALPDVPTFKELGYDMTPAITRGYGVPPGTPQEYIDELERILIDVASEDEELMKKVENEAIVNPKWGHEESMKRIVEMREKYKRLLEEVE
ncbi:MAG: tripartite tricarboxylate transporter substrate binding protein [Petrotogales bacterium]